MKRSRPNSNPTKNSASYRTAATLGFQPMSDRLVSLESKVAELRSLVGLETTAVVSRSEADEFKEKIKESELGKDGL